MRRLLLLCIFAFLYGIGMSNNVKINGEAKVVDFTGAAKDTAVVEFNLSWDNSWRDDFNWDAAWIFLKYKKRGTDQVWHHAYLCREGHTATPVTGNEGGDYTFMFGEVGSSTAAKVTGIYLMRDGISEGKVNAKVQVKWPIKSNTKLSLSASDFGVNRDSIYVAAYATEMVYVPYGSYMLGDNFSQNTFAYVLSTGNIPDGDNLIGRAGCVYSASSQYSTGYIPSYALPNDGNKYWCGSTSGAENWWQVDFGTAKTVRFFAVGTAEYAVASGYLEGSNTGASNSWTVLWSGGANSWVHGVTYPIPQKIKVTSPGSYRYYRVRMKCTSYSSIYNIAMTDKGEPIGDNPVLIIDSESAFNESGVSLPVPYPKGYRGYYMMKYEASQEQYVEFLNTLTLNQQKSRVANNNFTGMASGDYVFGGLKQPDNRNGIAFISLSTDGKTAVFGNNLNPNNEFYSEDDGQTLACNYLSPADMLAYCDWSGLRPMSELEYEKACRRPYPQIPAKGEFAWNENIGVTPITKLADLTGEKTDRETPFDYRMNVNVGDKLSGPVRSGAFATSKSSQRDAGATYWGVMEMSGNLWETCYNTTATGSVFKGDNVNYSHGDGYITDAGTDITATYWPTANTAFAVRGGSYAGTDELMRTSDRTYATGNYFSSLTRDPTVGFRGVRSILNSSGFTAGNIYCQNGLMRDTVCPDDGYTIKGDPAQNAIGKTAYLWYVSENGGTTWSIIEGATGLSLVYEKFVNTSTAIKTFSFKRSVTCAVGEEVSAIVTIVVSATAIAPALEDVAVIAVVGQSITLTMPAGPSGSMPSWILPDGTYKNSLTLTLPSFQQGQAGIYYATYSGGKCEGLKTAIEIYPYEEVGKQVFNYTGSEVQASVVATATHVRAYVIGAAGGLGSYGSSYSSGAGGYTDVLFPIANISSLGVMVGQGGRYGAKSGRTTAAYPNGGVGQGGDVAPGGGGGRSQVRDMTRNVLVGIAGGGGGCNNYAGNAGAGGGIVGQNSSSSYSTGGTQTAGGGPVRGGYLQGANATNNTSYDSGGGGDGYYGGGTMNGDGRPAAGGSGYINRGVCIMGKTYTGNVAARPSQIPSSIIGYSTSSYGSGVTGQNINGRDGMVVLQYLKRITK